MAVNFVSPGAAASEAMREEHTRREELRQQALMNEILQQRETRADTAESRMLAGQEAELAQGTTANELAQQQYEFNVAKEIIESAGADERLIPGTPQYEMVEKYFPGRIEEREAVEATLPSASIAGITSGIGTAPQADESSFIPGVVQESEGQEAQERGFFLRPGPRFEEKRLAEEATTEAARLRAEERAFVERGRHEDRVAREEALEQYRIDGLNLRTVTAEALQETRDSVESRNIQEAADKKTAEADRKEEGRITLLQYGDDMLEAIDELLGPATKEGGPQGLSEGAGQVIGSAQGRKVRALIFDPDSQAALSLIDRIIGNLAIGVLSSMKAQSRTGATGFGALSEGELNLIRESASILGNRKVSDERYAQELNRIRGIIQGQRDREITKQRSEQEGSLVVSHQQAVGQETPGGVAGGVPTWADFMAQRAAGENR